MRKLVLLFVLYVMHCVYVHAQDSLFMKKIFNAEYDVFMELNLYAEKVIIPGQNILGTVYGYLKKSSDSRVWIIMSVDFGKDGRSARLDMINDYGSEELQALLTVDNNGVYTLKQQEGSTIKVAGKGKWIKLPKSLDFIEKEK